MLKIVQNLWAVEAPPQTPLGKFTALLKTLAGGEGAAAAPPQEPHTRSRPSTLRSWPPMTNPGHALAILLQRPNVSK